MRVYTILDALWLIASICKYIKETGELALLDEIVSIAGINYGLMSAAVVLVVVPVLIVYVFMQKSIIKGMTAGAVKE